MGAYCAPPDPLAEIKSSFEILTKMLQKSILELVTPINIIFGCIQDNLCLKLHYARHVFAGLKSIKNLGPLTLRFGPSTLNALAPALVKNKRLICKTHLKCVFLLISSRA